MKNWKTWIWEKENKPDRVPSCYAERYLVFGLVQGHVGSSFNNPLWGLTGAGGQEPAVQVSCRQREVEHQRPLPVHSVQDVLHGHGRVGVRVLLARLSLHQQVGKGPSASALRHGQSFIMVTWAEVRVQRWSS